MEHHPALPYDELADFIAMLRSQEGIAGRALEFLILTAHRAPDQGESFSLDDGEGTQGRIQRNFPNLPRRFHGPVGANRLG